MSAQFWRRGAALLVAWSVAVLPAASARGVQEPALTVTVRDTTGVIPGASVTATPEGGPAGEPVRAITDDEGVARLGPLAPGTYQLRVSVAGFADAERRGVVVGGAGPVSLGITMRLPQFSEQVSVTTANRREQLLLDVAEPTVLIDQGQIADTSARTAKDLLVEQTGAGIQVQAGGGQGHLSLNGIPNSGVLVLVDGRRYLGKDANGNFNLEDLPMAGVERVEVVKGAGSALYGSDAIGGVVNFITRQSRERGVTSLVDLSGGSYGDWRVNQTTGWRGSRGGVAATAGYRTYDGFDLSESNPQTIGQPHSDWWSGSGNADFRLGDQVIARGIADYSRRDIDNYFFSGATQLSSTVYDSRRELTRYVVSPSVDYHVSDQTVLGIAYTRGKYLRDETRVFAADGRVAPQAPWRERNDELKVTMGHTWQAFGAAHPLQAGFERRQERLQRATLTVADPERDITVGWFQQEISVAGRLRVAAGARYDDYSDFGHEWSPKASAVFALAERQRLRASVGHGFRPPYFGELYLNTPPAFIGNPALKPETANTFNLGYSWAGERSQVSADYYRARVRNGITFDLSRQPFTYGNLRTFTSEGTNLSASTALPGGFTPSVSYSFNRREDDEGVEIGGYARHAAFVKLLWTHSRLGLRANLRGQVLGDVPPATDGSYQPGYQVWSGQVARRLTLRSSHAVTLYAQVANIFDKGGIFLRNAQGEPVAGDFQVWLAPRTFLAGATVDLDWAR